VIPPPQGSSNSTPTTTTDDDDGDGDGDGDGDTCGMELVVCGLALAEPLEARTTVEVEVEVGVDDGGGVVPVAAAESRLDGGADAPASGAHGLPQADRVAPARPRALAVSSDRRERTRRFDGTCVTPYVVDQVSISATSSDWSCAALPTRRARIVTTNTPIVIYTRIDHVGVRFVLPSTGSALFRGRVHNGRPGAPVGTRSAFRARDLQRGQLDAEGAAGQINFAGGDHHTRCTGADGPDDASHLPGGADRQNPSTAGSSERRDDRRGIGAGRQDRQAKCCCAERFTVSSTSSTSRRTQTAGNPNLVRSICLRRAPVGSESTRMTRATTMRRSSGRIRHVAPMSQR